MKSQKAAFNHLISCFWDKYSVLCPRFRYLGVESAEISKRITNDRSEQKQRFDSKFYET